MKKTLMFGLALMGIQFGSQTAQAAQIAKIDCKDLYPQAKVDLYFTTDSSATRKYPVIEGKLAYDYGNSKQHVFQSGMMKVEKKGNSNPEYFLTDASNSVAPPHVLHLQPTAQSDIYKGFLSGSIEIEFEWVDIVSYPLECLVQFAD